MYSQRQPVLFVDTRESTWARDLEWNLFTSKHNIQYVETAGGGCLELLFEKYVTKVFPV